MNDIDWFKSERLNSLSKYELTYRFYEEGDFGSLCQVIFESKKYGGNVDFWSLGSLGIFIYNYELEEEMLNVLLSPEEDGEKEEAFDKLKKLLL